MIPQPTKLELAEGTRLRIAWSDGQVREYAVRAACDKPAPAPPAAKSATRAAISAGAVPIVSDADIRPLRITAMKPVGNYAYSIDFSDGHNTGIYTLESLRELGEAV